MRAPLLLMFVLLCPPASADLFTAQLAYGKGDYERAFKDYRELAELGQPQAQYNLAVMYARGEGVRQSEINAYAWATLAAEGGEARGKALADKLRPGLAPGSEQIAEDIAAPFRRAALDERLMPKVEDDEAAQHKCRLRSAGGLVYPPDARRQGLQGDVVVEMTVLPDGSIRNPRIVYAVPAGVFEATVRDMAFHLSWEPTGPTGTAAHCHLMYRFQMP